MFSHIFIGISDFDRAYRFYSSLMECLSIEPRFVDENKSWAGWQSDGGRPLFVISKPFDGEPHQPGNGQMIAFLASNRETVRRSYNVALSLGGKCAGAPGLRPHYHENYYGAYFRDPDGNKICVACHSPEASTP